MLILCKKMLTSAKFRGPWYQKMYFLKLNMCVCLHTKFQVSSKYTDTHKHTLTHTHTHTPQNEPLKSPHSLRLKIPCRLLAEFHCAAIKSLQFPDKVWQELTQKKALGTIILFNESKTFSILYLNKSYC